MPNAPPYGPALSSQDFLRHLSAAPARVRGQRIWQLSGENTNAAADELTQLRREEYEIAERLESLKHNLARIQQVTRSTVELSAAVDTPVSLHHGKPHDGV